MTQAIALAGYLRDAGHEVVAACVGHAEGGRVPGFLTKGLQCPITEFESPDIKLDADSRSINVWKTTWSASRLSLHYVRSIRLIESTVADMSPDLVVNFYEPLTGLARMHGVPVVAIAHQYMFFHPRYPFSAGTRLQRQGLIMFTKLTAMGANKLLALSLFPSHDIPERSLTVVPPLLRPEVFSLNPRRAEPNFLLVYLWRPELVSEIQEWCEERPRTNVHCFLDHPGKLRSDAILPNMTLHHLDGAFFLEMMETCSGVATTAGFETTAEAMYLGKPLLMVPTHVEQQCNAMDAALLGAGYASQTFDLERLEHFTPRDQSAFKTWVSSGAERVVAELESVVTGTPLRSPDDDVRTHETIAI